MKLSAFLLALATQVLPIQATPVSVEFDVKSFGAVGDGKALDHPAINRAIDAAHDAGGGTVRLAPGTYRCFSIHLQSNVALRFEPGAVLLAADPTSGDGSYDPAEPNPADPYEDFGHSHWHNSLIWGENLENVSIIGPGLIHGLGLSRGTTGRMEDLPKASPSDPPPAATPPPKFHYPNPHDTLQPGVGNKSIALKNCHGVTLRDFSILHGGHFGILATAVDNLTVDRLKIDTNRDGIDIDACRNVRVTDCSVNSPWDDGICLKSSYGLGAARDTEDVTITGCSVSGDYEEGAMLGATWKHFAPEAKVPRMGRIKFGTESNGGFRRIAITNCVFDHCNGLAIESVDGGIIEDVVASNLAMHAIVGAPIFVRLGARLRGPEGTAVGAVRRVIISNVTLSGATGRYGSILSGVPGHPLEDVQISNVRGVQGGGSTVDALVLPPEKEDAYPEPQMFGPMPSWGFYVRHCVRLGVRDVGLLLAQPDQRPCVVLDDVVGADFDGLKAPARQPGQPLFRLRNSKNFTLHNCSGLPDGHREEAADETF